MRERMTAKQYKVAKLQKGLRFAIAASGSNPTILIQTMFQSERGYAGRYCFYVQEKGGITKLSSKDLASLSNRVYDTVEDSVCIQLPGKSKRTSWSEAVNMIGQYVYNGNCPIKNFLPLEKFSKRVILFRKEQIKREAKDERSKLQVIQEKNKRYLLLNFVRIGSTFMKGPRPVQA